MTIYTAFFRSDVDWAEQDIEAQTAGEALARARAFYADRQDELYFERYEPGAVNEIAIEDEDCNELAIWQDAEVLLRLAAKDLLAALQAVLPYAECEASTREALKDSPEAVAEVELAWHAIEQAQAAIASARGTS